MICYVCSSDKWHVVTVAGPDGIRVPVHSKSKIQICKDCGTACHEVDPKQEEKVKEYYRKEYRPAPGIANLITTTHKTNYVRVFLRDFLESKKGTRMKVADVGCATGYLLNFFRQMGHLATGCEYTVTFRRMAEHYYGIPTTEELETKHRYDFISIYHVMEHMVEPDKKLAHYASLLADGGHMLISTPEWFDTLEEASGTPTRDFEHWFHKDHINLFSATSLQNIFRKVGLSMVKEDHLQYGQTYLLKKSDAGPAPKDWLLRESWPDIERKMLAARTAIGLFAAGKWREALDIERLAVEFDVPYLGQVPFAGEQERASVLDQVLERILAHQPVYLPQRRGEGGLTRWALGLITK